MDSTQQQALKIRRSYKRKHILQNSLALVVVAIIGIAIHHFWPDKYRANSVACIGVGMGIILTMAAPTFVRAGKVMREARQLNENDLLM